MILNIPIQSVLSTYRKFVTLSVICTAAAAGTLARGMLPFFVSVAEFNPTVSSHAHGRGRHFPPATTVLLVLVDGFLQHLQRPCRCPSSTTHSSQTTTNTLNILMWSGCGSCNISIVLDAVPNHAFLPNDDQYCIYFDVRRLCFLQHLQHPYRCRQPRIPPKQRPYPYRFQYEIAACSR